MAIIKVNKTSEESSVNFLEGQSNILYTLDTNKITVNGVNVFVDKPKVGDIMCVTCYKDENGDILPADQQQVKWIDGLSINIYVLSIEYKLVGICVAINGNKAMVLYPEQKYLRWSASERWELDDRSFDLEINQKSHRFRINLNGTDHPNIFNYIYNDGLSYKEFELDFVDQLNDWFLANNRNYSAEVVDEDTDLPALPDSNNYRIVVNAIYTKWDNTFSMVDVDDGTRISFFRNIGVPVKGVDFYYVNNGFTRNWEGGCCRAKYYDYVQANQGEPSKVMEDINIFSGKYPKLPVRLVDFNNNDKCKILRDNFATYDKYFDSIMVKFPCGKGGVIAETPSGKENTYKLANCKFRNITNGLLDEYSILYPAANWAASIDINAPKLGKGNWWLPSAAEIAQMMRNLTYHTKLWATKPDIVNTVIERVRSRFELLSPFYNVWTSSKYNDEFAYHYSGNNGVMGYDFFYEKFYVPSITIYEF